jgi:hypothetical protein
MAHQRAGLRRQRAADLDIAHHDTVKKMHDIEITLVDRRVLTQTDHAGHRHLSIGERGHQPMFARHVVRARQQLAKRRATQHEATTGRVGDREGHV